MKKSLLLLIVALMCVAMYAATASALNITHTTEWLIDCDEDSAQDLGSITFTQTYPGEWNDATGVNLIYVSYQGNNSSELITFGGAADTAVQKVGDADDADWDPETDLTLADVALPDDGVVGDNDDSIEIDDFDVAATADLSTADGFTLLGDQMLETTGDGSNGDTNCTDDNCIITAEIYVLYNNGGDTADLDADAALGDFGYDAVDNAECLREISVIVGISAARPDLCSTTIKFPYVVSKTDSTDDTGSWMSALVVTNNASTTCKDNEDDWVKFHAWDEAGTYKGARGPYNLLRSDMVVVIPDDPDDGIIGSDWGVTAEALKGSSFVNGWFDSATSAWKSWLDRDGNSQGRGQVIAIINQNYAEGYQFMFSLDTEGGVLGFGTNLALKDLTNYAASPWDVDTIDSVEDYIGVYDVDAQVSNSSWTPISGGYNYATDRNVGIIGITAAGYRTRGTAGMTTPYYH